MVYERILPTTSNTEKKGVFTAYGSCEIASPAATVWQTVSDLSTYPAWNQYTPSASLRTSSSSSSSSASTSSTDHQPQSTTVPEKGQMYDLQYRFTTDIDAKPLPIEIMDVSHAEMYICWRGLPPGIPRLTLCAEKWQQVTQIDESRCRYEVWETQAGIMAHTVKWTFGSKLDSMNQGIADDLKRYLEAASHSTVTAT